MLAGRKSEASWEEFQRRLHNKLEWSEWEQGHLRMIGVDVSQLHDGSYGMDQKAYVDNIDPAEIKPERRKTPEASVTEQEQSTLRGLWGAMPWPCTQMNVKRACAVSVLQFLLPVALVGTLMKSNRVLKKTKSDLVNYVCAHIVMKVGCGGLVRCSIGQQELPVLNAWFLFRSYNNTNLLRRKTWCDSDSSSFRKIETKSKIEFERRQNKNYTSRDFRWQSFWDVL